MIKELRKMLISSTNITFIAYICSPFNSPMAKIIAWETITIKMTTMSDGWRSSLHACLRFLLLSILLLMWENDLSTTPNCYYMSMNSIVITSPNSILLYWNYFLVLLLLSWMVILLRILLFLTTTRCSNIFRFSCWCLSTGSKLH